MRDDLVEVWTPVERFRDFYQAIVALKAAPQPGADLVVLRAHDGYEESLPLEDLLAPDVLLADRLDGHPLYSSIQSMRGTVLAAVVVPQRWRPALLGAAEPRAVWQRARRAYAASQRIDRRFLPRAQSRRKRLISVW